MSVREGGREEGRKGGREERKEGVSEGREGGGRGVITHHVKFML